MRTHSGGVTRELVSENGSPPCLLLCAWAFCTESQPQPPGHPVKRSTAIDNSQLSTECCGAEAPSSAPPRLIFSRLPLPLPDRTRKWRAFLAQFWLGELQGVPVWALANGLKNGEAGLTWFLLPSVVYLPRWGDLTKQGWQWSTISSVQIHLTKRVLRYLVCARHSLLHSGLTWVTGRGNKEYALLGT